MSKELWDFIGVSNSLESEADQILDNILTAMFNAFETLLDMSYHEYSSIGNLINDGIKKNDEHTYFWSWFKDHGLDSLYKIMNSSLSNNDDTLDYLDDRLFLIKTDIENGFINSIFESIASTFTAIEGLINSREETAVGITESYSSVYLETFCIPIKEAVRVAGDHKNKSSIFETVYKETMDIPQTDLNTVWKYVLQSSVALEATELFIMEKN